MPLFYKGMIILSIHSVSIMQEISQKFKVLTTKDSHPIFEINGYLTNSKYNPIGEAKKIIEKKYKKHFFHILIGVGAGYAAEELFRKMDAKESMLIVEPNVELLLKLTEVRKLEQMLSDDRVSVISGIQFESLEEFLGAIVYKYNNRIEVIISPNYETIYPSYSKSILEKIKEILMIQVVNKNTMKNFVEMWQENFIENLFDGIASIPFSRLTKSLSCPIIIVSGGPSLIKQLPLIKEKRKNMFLLCAGSTINTLLKNEIVPDAIVSVDGGFENYKHFENLGKINVPLFFTPKIHKDILKQYKGKKIVFSDKAETQYNELLNNYVENEVGEVYGGPSVANYCLDIAVQLTTGPICLIGQDLAYTNNLSHAQGNLNSSLIDDEKREERRMFNVMGYYGEEVLTDYPFLSMKKAFEDYLCKLMDHRRIFNCTEGGALIKCIDNLSFSSFINKYCTQPVPDNWELLLDKKSVIKSKQEWERFYQLILKEKNKSNEVMRLCKRSIDNLSLISSERPIFNNSLIKKLNNADGKLKKLLENEFLFYLFGDVSFNINNYYLEQDNETKEEFEKRIYLKSYALYEGIYMGARESIQWLDSLLKKISDELVKDE